MAYAGTANTIPTGWMLAEGQSLPISEFELLYTVIGSTYGGNNTALFNLPDLVDRAVAGLGGFNPNLDGPVMLGNSYGSNGLTLTTSEVGSLAPPPSVAAGATAVYDPVTATPVIWTPPSRLPTPTSGGLSARRSRSRPASSPAISSRPIRRAPPSEPVMTPRPAC